MITRQKNTKYYKNSFKLQILFFTNHQSIINHGNTNHYDVIRLIVKVFKGKTTINRTNIINALTVIRWWIHPSVNTKQNNKIDIQLNQTTNTYNFTLRLPYMKDTINMSNSKKLNTNQNETTDNKFRRILVGYRP